jgi:hypothetical protein
MFSIVRMSFSTRLIAEEPKAREPAGQARYLLVFHGNAEDMAFLSVE